MHNSKKFWNMLIFAFEENSAASLNSTFFHIFNSMVLLLQKDQDGLYL